MITLKKSTKLASIDEKRLEAAQVSRIKMLYKSQAGERDH